MTEPEKLDLAIHVIDARHDWDLMSIGIPGRGLAFWVLLGCKRCGSITNVPTPTPEYISRSKLKIVPTELKDTDICTRFNPWTSLADAFRLVDSAAKQGFWLVLQSPNPNHPFPENRNCWCAMAGVQAMNSNGSVVHDPNPAVAISEALYKVLSKRI